MSNQLRPKLGCGDPEHLTAVTYPDVWVVEETTGPSRLRIGPSKNHIDVLLALAKELDGDLGLLYVLLVPRLNKRAPGRYQAPYRLSIHDVETFCNRFKAFFEGDGRHHLWIAAVNHSGLLVYDQHQWIYAYGDIPSHVAVLRRLGFVEGEINLPAPHMHSYNAEFDAAEDEVLAYWEWVHFPLQPDDDP